MRDFKSKRYWLIGASEGLGAALAHELSAAGADLILSARNEEALHALAESLPGQAEVVPIDVRDMDSVERAAHSAGSLDGLVYLAGVYWPFAAQAWHVEQTIAMCDVNFTGAARVLGVVVPQFVAKDSGHIVITGSIGGFRGLPSAIGYNASKAGVMALAESLYCDLRQSGVCVQLANPGFIKTRLTDKNKFNMPYIMPPEQAAKIMLAHMQSHRFKKSFPTFFSLLFRAANFLPDWLYYRLF